MKPSQLNLIERQVAEFRQRVGLSDTQPVNLRSLLLKLKVLTVFRPLSESFSGMSIKSPNGDRFMLINCNQPKGRQHFTIAHELYHLYIEQDPKPHNCAAEGRKSESEQNADAFALIFLMPITAIRQIIPDDELDDNISLATVIRLEQYFAVSRQAVLNRLSDTKFISRQQKEALQRYPVARSAAEYGYDRSLYLPGNMGLVIGDFGEKARRLFEDEKISEGHYRELLSKIGIDGE